MVFGFPDAAAVARGEGREAPPVRFGGGDGRSGLLPVLQAAADGALLAVAYAAVQATVGELPIVGPIELALLVGVGIGWSRRGRWRGAAADLAGTIALVVLGGATTWFLDPAVRSALVSGNTDAAFATHLPGWIGALAVLRGRSHRSRDDDEDAQDRLLRLGIPLLALPWLVGHLAADGLVERAFVGSAFVSTLLFAAAAFMALGLARLETVRRGADDHAPARRAWLLLVGGVALAVSLVGIPAAALLGVPVASLTAALVGPLRVLLLAVLLLTTPLIVAIAAITDLISPFLPRNIELPTLRLPNLRVDPADVSATPTVVFFGVLAVLLLVELGLIGLYVLYRLHEQRREAAADTAGFEERSIVRPDDRPAAPPKAGPPTPAIDPRSPSGAYLAALELVARDETLARRAHETPRMHLARVRPAPGTAFARIAADYQLDRYGGRLISVGERRRIPGRLAAIRRWIRDR